MIYPKFLRPGDTVGITAPSAPIGEGKRDSFALSLSHLKAEGYRIVETPSVYGEGWASAPGDVRAAELLSLVGDPEVDMIFCATGGDFLIDMLPYVDFEAIRRNPKWIQGYSDPTGLLFPITTGLDVATIYGCNAGGFDMEELHSSLRDNLALLRGEVREQKSFALYERSKGDGAYNLTEPVRWETPNGPVDVQGRLIGGCMECLCDLIGTPYDHAADFAARHREEGLIWYFDVFALKAETVYNSLWHMKQAGWFEGARGFLFGRVLFPGTFLGMSYEEAALRALGMDVPIVMEADVGHVSPRMTLINGSLAHLTARDGKGTLRMELKE